MTGSRHTHFALLAAAALLVAVAVALFDEHPGLTPVAIAGILGSATVLVLLPVALVVFDRRVGWAVLGLLAFGFTQSHLDWLGIAGARAKAPPQLPVAFYGRSCEFGVTFPGIPSIEASTLPGLGDYEQAMWGRQTDKGTVVLRTECVNVPGLAGALSGAGAKAFIVAELLKFTDHNELTDVYVGYTNEPYGHTGRAKGVKLVNGLPVTYQVQVVAGERSFLTLYVGGDAAGYPQPEIAPFLASVRRQEFAAVEVGAQ